MEYFPRVKVPKEIITRVRLPEDFLFGVSNSAFQVEGGFNQEELPYNNWCWQEQSGRAERTGLACNFWENPDAHIDLAASLGLNAFRMSLEWARVAPTTKPQMSPPPSYDLEAIKRYAGIIAKIMDKGMEPVITLHHFTHPAWGGEDLWLRSEMTVVFTDYIKEVVENINECLVKAGKRPVRFWVTINEPNAFSMVTYFLGEMPHRRAGINSLIRSLDNLLTAHILAYDAIHDLYEKHGWEPPMVSYNTYCICFYSLGKMLADLLRSRELRIGMDDLQPYARDSRKRWEKQLGSLQEPMARNGRWGRWLERAVNSIATRALDMEDLVSAVNALYASPRERKIDYVGLDIYDPLFRNFIKLPSIEEIREGYKNINAEHWQWIHDPEVFYTFILAYQYNLEGLPVYILENGMAHKGLGERSQPREDGLTRDIFLRNQLAQVARAVVEGVPVKGYFYWSLTDNYEWGSFTPRFGLYAYNYRENRIEERDGLDVEAGKVYAELVHALRSSDAEAIERAFGLT